MLLETKSDIVWYLAQNTFEPGANTFAALGSCTSALLHGIGHTCFLQKKNHNTKP